MTKDELKIRVEKAFSIAEGMLQEAGMVVPLIEISIVKDDDKKGVVAFAFGGISKEKTKEILHGFGLLMGAMQVVGRVKEVSSICMSTEAWMSMVDKDKADEYEKKYKGVSEDPNKIEVLITAGRNMAGDYDLKVKSMFSVEVKGKRHFTLNDIPQLASRNGEAKGGDSALLDRFFNSYQVVVEQKNPLARMATEQYLQSYNPKTMAFDDMLQSGINVILKEVGGVGSETIKSNKKI